MTPIQSVSQIISAADAACGDGHFGAAKTALNSEVDLQGWNSDHEIFYTLVAEVQPKTIIEVGTWKGRSAMHFAKATEALLTNIFCVDTWLGGVDHVLSSLPQDNRALDMFGSPRLYHQFLRNFSGTPHAERIFPIQNTSLNGARILKRYGVSAELIYIDGSHEYEDVYADLCAYELLLAPKGRMFGDDFRTFPGVFASVLRFAHERRLKLKEIDHNFWILLFP